MIWSLATSIADMLVGSTKMETVEMFRLHNTTSVTNTW